MRLLAYLIPIHLLAFVLLYAGAYRLMRHELLASHADSARLFADTVVEDLHPVMVLSNDVRAGLRIYTESHDLFRLQLLDREGDPIAGDAAVYEGLRGRLSDGGEEPAFELVRDGDRWRLDGLVPIVSEGHCADCHEVGQRLGTALLEYDVTPFLTSARGKLRRDLAILVTVWAVIFGALTVVTGRSVRRSMARLKADVEGTGNARTAGMSDLILDPVSAELHGLLREAVAQQRRREQQLASRMHHTERLASLGQMAAGLAHEIKNPLAGLQGAVEVLRDDEAGTGHGPVYEEMLGEIRRMNEIVQSLLHFARPSRPQPEAVDPAKLLDGAVRLMTPFLRRRGVVIETQIAPAVGRAMVDPDQLRQVLVNLVTNAAEAMPDGGHIRLGAAPLPDRQGLLVSVQDDGPGVPEDLEERIFEPFFTTKHGGTGLGLAVVRSLVEAHGGQIRVTSRPGDGTSFLILLPCDMVASGA